jgi:hypothetical protein
VRYVPLIAVAALGFSGLACAALVYASNEPIVAVSALKAVEDAANREFLHDSVDPVDPWEPLGDARGTYLPGYGAVFTFEMSLVNVTPITPFHTVISPQEVKSVHARKMKKLPVLKSAMRELIVKSASTLSTLPASEQITLEAFLDYFSFEDRASLPRRLVMTASRQQILDAVARHAPAAELAALIEEREEQ